MIEKVVIME